MQDLLLPDLSNPTTPPYMPPPPGYDPSLSQANQTQPQTNYGGGLYGGGIVGMRNNQIAARLGGGMVPMYYGG